MSKTIGILGGMGPMATVDLFEKIVRMTPASTDQEHHRILIYNNPKIPSRMAAGLNKGPSPLPELIKTAKCLEQAGADFLIMPCHTAHIWLEEIQAEIHIPIISLIENTADYIKQHYPHLSGRILLLSSRATIKHGLYQSALQSRGLEIHIPTLHEQQIIESAIGQVKASSLDPSILIPFHDLLNQYYEKGILALLGGCTEIPLLFPKLHLALEKLDPTIMLAERAINLAKQIDGGEQK